MAEVAGELRTVEDVVAFHGHMCPGLVIGIKAAEVALEVIGPHSIDEEVVALVETDMCGVDAIQFLTGCTFGKGNLVHLDHGKNVFTFARRSDGKAIRVGTRSDAWGALPLEVEDLFAKMHAGVATDEERSRIGMLQQQRCEDILRRGSDELFDIKEVEIQIPRPARVMSSVECDECREATMETRVTLLEGRLLCRPCFEKAEARRTKVESSSQ